ncbi:PREDICTED: nuclear transcription factor Y subunit C-10-like [Tarenaya hassleriana]|uniref:nuclear transcription factor Y subunit C-10-like n=1 Tax=Tarenaya hassleriana TaxID=28532 RepID=UPI00053CA223|nr:PREDICTED: nuclear transcription factor Y subunit C-10-like [Tarenaya hassleriana]XP_010537296.1 PREDICTED: nuclear transcription factor Y subunit C-10-like [Tarenaya hassleriana]XP_010537297.1 PREDICTED: nuclear transcription factor Y subunit C-10-like [Tarenaya hassleriana]XP_010537300.1 PREDICTED: nuclear transcription factor Y subunit C-10-like [Tarenaya hassleriana]XP_010537302.1 PREDICTED: nuclear transcription factor Y subunit C-10-like [Tarenaya hassleriana]XP_010537303.1 PREDICTED:
MKRSFVNDPAFDPNALAKSSRVWMQPPYHGMHNTMPMPEMMLPCYPATSEVDEDYLKQKMGLTLEVFWQRQLSEMKNFTGGFKSENQLPLARVKKIMKSDPEVKMISADTPPVFAKACEMFILEMTLRAWIHTESRNRDTIQRCDLAEAVKRSETFDFLIDLVPFGPHCVRHQGVDQNAVQEQVGPAATVQPVFPLPNMDPPVNLNPIEQNLEVPPELLADSFMTDEPFDLNFDFP